MVIPFEAIAPVATLVGLAAVGGWVFTTWLRIKNGYPLENSWGKSVYPKQNEEMVERVKLVSSENAQLRAEISAIKDRLATVERIVTDSSYRLDREIDALRGPAN
ncbi:hypothetical protein [Sphingomonas crocodyli]|uniref:Uncharacterized protein n=1 Tax=Sphingomonas crocodyli TaxID=1979270 RepID=A0A437LWP7_9SPHN|nr:hypothetical protein [Sphingomonas crocodyli]RVT89812.1 hypothetical protein EOD43_20775 [Sphingomonas crocodyli]